MSDSRDVSYKRESADYALERYAEALREWNAPDDEHTCLQLRAMVEEVITAAVLRPPTAGKGET